MELTKIILVTFFFAAASSAPYNNGVKGGSIAKSGSLATGAVGFPIGIIPFKGTGSGSFSSSGSFSESSASSYASSNSASFNFHGSDGATGAAGLNAPGAFSGSAASASAGAGTYDGLPGNGVQQTYQSGGIGGGGGAGATAGANSISFANSLAGSSGHGPGYSPSSRLPCSGGNCPTSSGQTSECKGENCGINSPPPKCISGNCTPKVNGVPGQHHGNSDGGNVGTLANANSGAYSGSLAASSGHGPGYSSSLPCSGGNCPSSSGQKVECQGSSCSTHTTPEKCTSGQCHVNLAPSTNTQHGFTTSQQPPTIPTLGYVALDENDRPGKVDVPIYNDNSYPIHNKVYPSSSLGSPQSGHICSSPNCNGPQYAPAVGCSSSSTCSSKTPSGPSISNSNPPLGSGVTAPHGTFGGSPHVNVDYSHIPTNNPKPGYTPSSTTDKSPYGGSFGGPPGILRPNDYSVSHQPNQHPQYVTPTHGSVSYGPQSGFPSSPSIYNEPPHLHTPSYPPAPAGTVISGSVLSPSNGQKPANVYHSSSAPSSANSGSFSGATASAHAASYTGGFGGPPGILKPNDFGFHGIKPGSVARPHGDKEPNRTPQPIGISPSQPNYEKPDFLHKPSSSVPSTTSGLPYTGGFGGAPGVLRPNGPVSTGALPSDQKQDKPVSSASQHIFPGKPGYTCSPGSGPECGSTHIDGQLNTKPVIQIPGYGCGPGTGLTCGVSQSTGQQENKPLNSQYDIPSKPGYNCDSNSDCSGTQTFGQQGSITHTPQQDYPHKPGYGCSSGSICDNTKPIGTSQVNPNIPQYPTSPGFGCSSGSECDKNVAYQGGFGGAPGVIKPPNSALSGAYSSRPHFVKPDISQPQVGQSSGSGSISTNPANTDGSYYSGYSISPSPSGHSTGGISGSTAGAFAGATSFATSGSFSSQGEHTGQRPSGSQGGYSGLGNFGGVGGISYSGAHGHPVKGGYVKDGCSGGCDGEGKGSDNEVGPSYGAGSGAVGVSGGGVDLNLGDSLTKGLAHSFGELLGQEHGADGNAATAGAHSSALSVGGGSGAFSAAGSFASAQAGAGTKSYRGGYH